MGQAARVRAPPNLCQFVCLLDFFAYGAPFFFCFRLRCSQVCSDFARCSSVPPMREGAHFGAGLIHPSQLPVRNPLRLLSGQRRYWRTRRSELDQSDAHQTVGPQRPSLKKDERSVMSSPARRSPCTRHGASASCPSRRRRTRRRTSCWPSARRGGSATSLTDEWHE